MAELRLIPLDEQEAAPAEKAVEPIDIPAIERKPKVLNNLAAGALDLIATLPGIPGLVQAIGELPYRAATSGKPFLKDVSDSLDNDFMKLAKKGYDWSTEITGAGTGDMPSEQAARLASLLIPISAGSSIARGASAAARGIGIGTKAADTTGKVVGNTANILSPLVKLEKAKGAPLGGYLTGKNALRYGTQAGLAVGIEQGSRAAAGMPTMFSDGDPPTVSVGTDSGELKLIPLDDSGTLNLLNEKAGGLRLIPLDETPPASPTASHIAQPTPEAILEQKRALDKQLEDEESFAIAKSVMAGIGVLSAVYGVHKWRAHAAIKRMQPGDVAPAGLSPVVEDSHMTALEKLHARAIDKNTTIVTAIKAAGHGDKADVAVSQMGVNTPEMLNALSVNGRWPGYDGGPAIEFPVPLAKFAEDAAVLKATKFPELGGMSTEEALETYMTYSKERQNRITATGHKYLGGSAGVEGKRLDVIEDQLAAMNVPREQYVKTGLFDESGRLRENEDIFAKGIIEQIDDLDPSHPLRVHIKQHAEINDKMLDVLEKHGAHSKEFVTKLREQVKTGEVGHYIPGIEARGSPMHQVGQWMQKITKGTSDEAVHKDLTNMMKTAVDPGKGILRPMGYVEGMNQYIYNTLDFVNRNKAQGNVLKLLDNPVQPSFEAIAKGAKPLPRRAILVGVTDPDLGSHLPKWEDNLPKDVADKFGVNSVKGDPNVIKTLADETIPHLQGSKVYHYYVPDKMLRDAIRMEPRLYHTLNAVGRIFKNLYHATTVRLPMFIAKSMLYQMGQTGVNAFAHNVPYNVLKDTWRGIVESYSLRMASETVNQISYGLRTNTGFFAKHPELAAGLAKRMENVIKNSMLMQFRAEAGGFATAMGSHEVYIGARDVMKMVSPGWKSNYSTATALWRAYTHLTDSMREGASIGLALRMMKDRGAKSGKELRKIKAEVEDIAGNIKRVGSSALSEAVQSWVPFSGPMIDAWNTIGIAAKKNPQRFAQGVGAFVVIPTLLELTLNHSIGKEYRDHYWNKFSTEQRNNNMLLMIPGLPPERAVVMPITPEWSIARAMTIELFDLLTGASDVGNSGLTGENGSHFFAAMQRTFNLATPPLMQAWFANQGEVLEIGPTVPIGNKTPFFLSGILPDRVGQYIPDLYSIHPMGKGEQISGARGRARYTDAVFDKELSGVLQAFIGGVASLMTNIAESFRQGKRTSTEEAFSFGLEAAGRETARQANYLNPLFPVMRQAQNDDISDHVRIKREGLSRLTKELNNLMANGAILSFDNPLPNPGNALDPVNDPVFKDTLEYVNAAKFNVGIFDKQITEARTKLDIARSSSTWNGQRLSRAQQAKVEDTLVSEIKAAKAKQLAELQRLEAAVSESLSQKYGREIDIDFSTFKARPNLPGGGK